MHDERPALPDSTAVRVALWRAMHMQVDRPPHVLEDEIGLPSRQDVGTKWRMERSLNRFASKALGL
jgi:hypothetical protein